MIVLKYTETKLLAKKLVENIFLNCDEYFSEERG